MASGIPTPRLAEKLYQIRTEILNLSQNEMIDHLGLRDMYERAFISFWENGKLEPPLAVLYRYARAAGISIDVLADDNLNLPTQDQRGPRSGGRLGARRTE